MTEEVTAAPLLGIWDSGNTTGSIPGNYLYPWYNQHDDEVFSGPDFRCERCVHYEGSCKCDLNVFIYAVGVDMSACWGFEEGITCRHCGKRT